MTGPWIGSIKILILNLNQILSYSCGAMLRPVVPDRVELSLKGVVGRLRELLAVDGWVFDPDIVHRRQLLNGWGSF